MRNGREMADFCRRKLIGERDNDWATALQPVTGSHSMSPETAAARVGIAITEAKVRLLYHLEKEVKTVGPAAFTPDWLRYQREKLHRDGSLPWESTPAVLQPVRTTETAQGSPISTEEVRRVQTILTDNAKDAQRMVEIRYSVTNGDANARSSGKYADDVLVSNAWWTWFTDKLK